MKEISFETCWIVIAVDRDGTVHDVASGFIDSNIPFRYYSCRTGKWTC